MTIESESTPAADRLPSTDPSAAITTATPNLVQTSGNNLVALIGGAIAAGFFYGLVYSVPWAPLQRYFLGHPVAVAATVLFWVALAVLLGKWLSVLDQFNRLSSIRDSDLSPAGRESTPASRWLSENDAGHVARQWLSEITQLPVSSRSSLLVRRLEELLTRQSQRGTARHLADDLRELSSRDADAAHDSLGLVRIIVWAIPMLGFLGTVIGITQTLGGLDFSNGSAAVDNLKSGLYVAFDTTALGLVLSVVAIFLQFPVERSEQRLLAEIDNRVGHLVSESLPSDEASDNQTVLIAELCRGVQAAVAESLDNQAKLWRETIDEAQTHWQSTHDLNTNRLAEAFELTLVPALLQHGESLAESSQRASQQLSTEHQRLQSALTGCVDRLEACGQRWDNSLIKHSESLRDHAQALDDHAATLEEQQQAVVDQYHALTTAHQRADSLLSLQRALNDNLRTLEQTNESIDQSVQTAAGQGMAEAMRILARAVDVLTARLAGLSDQPSISATTSTTRRAA